MLRDRKKALDQLRSQLLKIVLEMSDLKVKVRDPAPPIFITTEDFEFEVRVLKKRKLTLLKNECD